jgi:Holliday junction resolvase RusA-like endonuclease
MRLTFVVHGPPVPKARARVTGIAAHLYAMLCGRCKGIAGKAHATTPDKTKAYEKHVAVVAFAARTHSPRWPWQDKDARYGISVRVFRSRDQGDLDNYEKGVQDACNNVLWHDDSQIRRRGEGGIWACEKGKERIEVDVWTLD